MKRYLTVGIISGVLMVIVVAFSWFTFPGWQNPASGGFWALLGATVVGVVVFVQSLVSIWKDLKEEDKEKLESKSALKNVELNIGENVDKSNVFVGDNNVINNYFPIVEKNIEKNEPDFWNLKHPYPMPPNFTGRITERAMLTQWLNDDSENRLFILRALGGFGKSALTWHWLTHDVDPKEWKKVIFWSFYEGDASFENFITETLKYLNLEIPQGQRIQVDELLKVLQREKVLLIIDGFERLLRAYSNMNASRQSDSEKYEDKDRDCVDLNVEHFLKSVCSMPSMKSKALMTTRMSPRALEKFGQFIEGCFEKELKEMGTDDAIAFFRAQGVHKGTNQEIVDVCKLYGFHPLSLRLLAGHIMTDFKNAGDIVVAQKLKVTGDITKHQNHILEISYTGLPLRQQKLLSTIACFRSSTKLEVLESIVDNKDTLENDLHNLMESGLLQYDDNNKIFDLHPIVRRFAYDRLAAKDRIGAHEHLINYFETIPKPEKVEKLEDLMPVIEMYHHMVRAGNLDEALKLFYDRLFKQIYFQFGAYQLVIELLRALFLDGEDKHPRLKGEALQTWTLDFIASNYALSGQPRRAVQAFQIVISIDEKNNDKSGNAATTLGNLAIQQWFIGSLKVAENNLRHRIDISREVESEFIEAVGHQELGRVLSFRGAWQEAEQELDSALKLFEKHSEVQSQSVTWSYRTLCFLLMEREETIFDIRKPSNEYQVSAVQSAHRAFELTDENARTFSPLPRDYVRTHWLLGAAYRMNNDLTLAEENLFRALNLCRQINSVDGEADILLELAKLRYAQKNYPEAKSLAYEALTITERCGYVLQGADVNLFLSQYALEQEKDKVQAKEYAETALKLAYCDGPPYYYKVAYHEAEAMLEKISKLK